MRRGRGDEETDKDTGLGTWEEREYADFGDYVGVCLRFWMSLIVYYSPKKESYVIDRVWNAGFLWVGEGFG